METALDANTVPKRRWEALQDPRVPKLTSLHPDLQLSADRGGLDTVGLVLSASSDSP